MKKAWLSERTRLFGLIVLILVGAAGCTSISQTMQAWVGHPFSALIAAWGPPDKTLSDGRGGQIVIYTHTARYVEPPISTTTYEQNTTEESETEQSTTVYNPEVVEVYTSYRMFFINADGIIYSWAYRNR